MFEVDFLKSLFIVAEKTDQEKGPNYDDGEEDDPERRVDLIFKNFKTPSNVKEADAIVGDLQV